MYEHLQPSSCTSAFGLERELPAPNAVHALTVRMLVKSLKRLNCAANWVLVSGNTVTLKSGLVVSTAVSCTTMGVSRGWAKSWVMRHRRGWTRDGPSKWRSGSAVANSQYHTKQCPPKPSFRPHLPIIIVFGHKAPA